VPLGSEIDFDEYDDGDMFESQEKITMDVKKPYEVDFKVYSPEDIRKYQDGVINEVKDLLEQPPEATAILLRYFRWNRERLVEAYMDRREEVLEEAGLGEAVSIPPRLKKVPNFSCDICCEDEPDTETFALKCDHRFCSDCYRHYLASKIKDEGEAARIKCPGDSCNRIVDSKSMDLLLPVEVRSR
jgi:ariadne-1